jgi:hypothetical protein
MSTVNHLMVQNSSLSSSNKSEKQKNIHGARGKIMGINENKTSIIVSCNKYNSVVEMALKKHI